MVAKDDIEMRFGNATDRLILLDYDGTLVNFTALPRQAILPGNVSDLLVAISHKPHTKLVIVTGRGFEAIDELAGHLPIDIIAEHGAMMKENGVWQNHVPDMDAWRTLALDAMHKMIALCAGSLIEQKRFSLTWHYRNASSADGYLWSRELIDNLEPLLATYNLKILDGNKVVEIMSNDVGKGKGVQRLIAQHKYDFILAAGDDKTDEEMFEFLVPDKSAITIKVGSGDTLARVRLDAVEDVVELLEKLSAV